MLNKSELQHIDDILKKLYDSQCYVCILGDIFIPANPNADKELVFKLQKLMISFGLIEENRTYFRYGNSCKITTKGNEIMLNYGSYSAFMQSNISDKKVKTRKDIIGLWSDAMKLIQLIIGLMSFILGVLLADPIKEILRKLGMLF